MDRGEGSTESMVGDPERGSVAAGASARVAEILEEAERHGRELNEQAERDAASARSDAEAEAERILAEAREAARAAATERVRRLAELQGALARRGPAVLEGLEGAGLTRARLEALIAALAASSDRVLAEAEEGAPGRTPPDGAAASPEADADAPEAEAAPSEAEAAPSEEPADSPDDDAEASEDAEDPVAAAEELAKPVEDAEPADDAAAEADGADATAAAHGNGDDPAPQPYDGPLPEGAPMARQPLRSPERDARFAALLLAVPGRERGDVEAHLRSEYGFEDCEPILDEVFGPARA